MKIIDLLNKIANGEEVPITIKYQDNYYNLLRKYNENWKEYEFGYKHLGGGYLNIWRENVLNDEVEIIEEEKKIPEKLEEYIHTDSLNYNQCNYMFEKLTNKYNEIIDYLKNKGE